MIMRDLLPNMRSLSALLPIPDLFLAGRRPAVDPSMSKVPPLRPRVEIPICDPGPDAEAATHFRMRGQFLARQEDWETLAQEITKADANRALTPGLRSIATLLSEGARIDIAAAIAETLARDQTRAVANILGSLDMLRAEMPDCPAIAHVLAMAHVDAARAWDAADVPESRACHMAAATALNDCFDPFEYDSPMWASVRCAVLEADPAPRSRVADDYEDLIDLDPGNPWHLWHLGRELRPERFGSWEILDQQARRTATRTTDVWGLGGYVWIYYGAIATDPGAIRRVDGELFAEGLHDILGRHGTQDMANRMAAMTGFTLGGYTDPGSARRRVADCLGWIAQDHLREVHPMIWFRATPPDPAKPAVGGSGDPVRIGRTRALSTLSEFYAPALDSGRRLSFGPEGMQMIKEG